MRQCAENLMNNWARWTEAVQSVWKQGRERTQSQKLKGTPLFFVFSCSWWGRNKESGWSLLLLSGTELERYKLEKKSQERLCHDWKPIVGMFSVASQYCCKSAFLSSWRTAFCLKILSFCFFEQLPYWTRTFSFRLLARPFNREVESRAPKWEWLRTFNTLSLSVPTPSYPVQHYNSRLYYGFWCWTKPSTEAV